MPNRLQFESSPYLLQHAQNPVDWFPWSEEAFEKAKREHKPVLVSIGYAACHWCHVMEHESFEDAVVADFMNQHFVCVKVDREEHPDVDHLYMDALQAMSGQGGWPLNMFVTPDKKPFYGGTYFPPKAMYGRSSWTELLEAIRIAWQDKQQDIELQSNQMVEHLKQANLQTLQNNRGDVITKENIDAIVTNLLKSADTEWGGFGAAPKFPATGSIQFLLEYYHFFKGTSLAESALQQALLSLDKMIAGGIYDQVGGGFSRYSTDKEWLAPHFEKMLYDNALLISVLSSAYRLTKLERYKMVITEIIDFCNRELKDEKSDSYYCALDADSEGVEGKYYTWTWQAFQELLPDAHPALIDYFGITEEGNWEHTNILYEAVSFKEIEAKFQLSAAEWQSILTKAKAKIFAKRQERIRPSTDDKILLSWNALMNIALVDAALALEEPAYVELAKKHMTWMLSAFSQSGEGEGLLHVYKNGLAKIPAKLDDYAYLIKALTHLASASVNPECITTAFTLQKYVQTHFLSEDYTFYYFSASTQTDIPVRKIEVYDGATPSANAVMMEVLGIMGNLMEQSNWLEQSEAMLKAQQSSAIRYPSSFSRWAIQLQRVYVGTKQLVVIGDQVEDKLKVVHRHWLPEIYAIAAVDENIAIKAIKGKLRKQETFFYLCKDFSCGLPVKTVEAALGLKV